MSQFIVALIPSPLAGPLTWAPVARALRERGQQCLLCSLDDGPCDTAPLWTQHALSVMRQLAGPSGTDPVVLAAHSGAGPLLPALGALCPRPVAGYLFADAGLPDPGRSRLDEISESVPELADALRAGERFPQWTADDLREEVPDEVLRAGLVAELRPRSLDFFTEHLPAARGWPDAPCGYLRLSEGYEAPAARAQVLGWPVLRIDGGHFHMLREPGRVAGLLLELLDLMRVQQP